MNYFLWCIILYFSVYNVISTKEKDYREYNTDTDEDYENETIAICETPSLEPEYCVSLVSCPRKVKAIATSKSEPISFFTNSSCGNFRAYFEIAKKLNEAEVANREFVIKNILPKESYCGLQHADDRLYNGNETALDEIPWLVNFVALTAKGPPKRDDFYNYCIGVLISNQHVLSSSYCSKTQLIIKAVRLAQHNLRKNNICVKDPLITECSNFIEIPIVQQLVIGDSNSVLYKLQRSVEYDDYIRPICLPLHDLERPKISDLLITSGWSDTEENKVAKKRILSKVLNSNECKGLNTSVLYGRINRNYALCTIKDSISNSEIGYGDQGGPFTYSYKHQWFIEGIVNYVNGDYLIGEKIMPHVRNWILDGLFYFYKNS